MSKQQSDELQNPRTNRQPCDPTDHLFIPINTLRNPKDVEVIGLCQKCGLVTFTRVGYPPQFR